MNYLINTLKLMRFSGLNSANAQNILHYETTVIYFTVFPGVTLCQKITTKNDHTLLACTSVSIDWHKARNIVTL